MDNQMPSNPTRHNKKVWLKTYEDLGLTYDIVMPADNTSLIDIFENSFAKYGNKTAFICMGASITFKEVDERSKQVAVYLQSLGLVKGDKVAVMMPNVLQLPVAVIGVLRAGLTLVNVNPLYTTKELEHQLTDSNAKALIMVENFAKTYQDIGRKVVEHVVITGMGDMMGTLKGFMVNAVVRHVKKMVPEYNIANSVSFKAMLKNLLPVNTSVQLISVWQTLRYYNIPVVLLVWPKGLC